MVIVAGCWSSAGKGRPVEEQLTVTRNVALQREWYGEPLGDRVRRLVVAFAVSQAQLAEVLGLSPPRSAPLCRRCGTPGLPSAATRCRSRKTVTKSLFRDCAGWPVQPSWLPPPACCRRGSHCSPGCSGALLVPIRLPTSSHSDLG